MHRRASAEEMRSHLPTVRSDRLVAGFVYYDARTDDARLTLDLVRTAADHGAAVTNHAQVVELRKDSATRICGARIQPQDWPQDGPEGGIEIRARAVVSATGVWADEIVDLGGNRDYVMRPAKGIHIVVPRTELPCDAAFIIPSPSDGRSIFAIPWGDKTYVGTTDTGYEGPLRHSTVDQADVAYLLDAVNAVVTHPVTADVITGTWSGLRPLLAPKPGQRQSERTADLSRRHKVLVSPSGLITVTGGKLTTYRKMAADTVDVLVRRLGVGARHGWTEHLPVHGSVGLADLRRPDAARQSGVDEATFAHLLSRYGDDVPGVLAVVGERPEFAAPLLDGQPFLTGEVIYAVRCEMATTVEDVLSRRIRLLPFDAKAASAAAARVAELAAGELGWDRERTAAEVKAFRELAAASLSAVAGKEGGQQ
jgi:glycerol-3-phosphate dehydrogenase